MALYVILLVSTLQVVVSSKSRYVVVKYTTDDSGNIKTVTSTNEHEYYINKKIAFLMIELKTVEKVVKIEVEACAEGTTTARQASPSTPGQTPAPTTTGVKEIPTTTMTAGEIAALSIHVNCPISGGTCLETIILRIYYA